MAVSTIPLSRSITLASQFLRNAPLAFSGQNNDPALSNADWVKQTMLAPPFSWWWNRSTGYNVTSNPTFVTQSGVSDYTVAISDFGWLERAAAYDTTNAYVGYELKVDLLKGQETQVDQPARISVQGTDGSGNVTFRMFPTPDVVYNVVVDYQKSASLFAATTDTWAPIPDYLSFVYEQGFIARCYEYDNDPRWIASLQLFYQMLADNAEGLDLSQKNLWLSDRINFLREMQRVQTGKG